MLRFAMSGVLVLLMVGARSAAWTQPLSLSPYQMIRVPDEADGPGRLPVEAPRILLTQTTTVNIRGTVEDAVREVARVTGMDWLVGTRRADVGPTAAYRAVGVPAWQALDQLLDVYGYDWGAYAGIIVCWPTMEPRRVRNGKPPPEPADAPLRPTVGEPLFLPDAIPLADVLQMSSQAMGDGRADRLDGGLHAWRVVGCIGHLTRVTFVTISLAVGATLEEFGSTVVWRVSARRRLDETLEAIRGKPWPAPGRPGDEPLTEAFRAQVPPLLSSQQWMLITNGGTADIRFRELPPALAEAFVQAVREQFAPGSFWDLKDRQVDWTRPGAMVVSVERSRRKFVAPDGAQHTPLGMAARCRVPLKDNAGLLEF
jgi:hypothetical protein